MFLMVTLSLLAFAVMFLASGRDPEVIPIQVVEAGHRHDSLPLMRTDHIAGRCGYTTTAPAGKV